MRRRDLISAGTFSAVAGSASAATSADTPPAAATLNLTPVGLPVITEGRLRNYVFVQLRLHLASGRTADMARPYDPFIRDALVRAAHRVSFAAPDDWTRLNERALGAAALAAAEASGARGVIARVEIVNQEPRRRTGMRGV